MSQLVIPDPRRAGAAAAETGSSAALAAALIEIEARIAATPPDSMLLTDASDEALAALLVATKALIPVSATEVATDASTANGRLIEVLAEAYTRPS